MNPHTLFGAAAAPAADLLLHGQIRLEIGSWMTFITRRSDNELLPLAYLDRSFDLLLPSDSW